MTVHTTHTTLGLVGSAILMGPTGLSLTLAAQRTVPIRQQDLMGAMHALNGLEMHLARQGLPTAKLGSARDSLEAARSEGERMEALTETARVLAGFSDRPYSNAAQAAAHTLSAASRFAHGAEAWVSAKEAHRIIVHAQVKGGDQPLRLLEEMQEAARAMFGVAVDGMDYSPLFIRLKNATEAVSHIFDEIIAGRITEPPDSVTDKLATLWIKSLNYLRQYYAASNPPLARKLFWDGIRTLTQLMPRRRAIAAISRADTALALMMARFLDNDAAIQNGDFSSIRDGSYVTPLAYLEHEGFLPTEGEPDGYLPHAEEMWPDGESSYVHAVLKPAFEHGLDYLITHYAPELHDLMRHVASAALSRYQEERAYSPYTPVNLALTRTAINVYNNSTGNVPPQTIFFAMAVMHENMSRHIATLPDDVFDEHWESIVYEFPDALHYRGGLGQTIDRERIEAALRLPDGGERLIMHLATGRDVGLVRQSLEHLTGDGRVVIVDVNPQVFDVYREDRVTQAAIASGRLLIEAADYTSDPFQRKYRDAVTRAYAIHPVGKPESVAHTVIARGGLMVVQDTDNLNGLKYVQFRRPMFVTGDFREVAGYSNGPAWFDTESSRLHSKAGLMLSISRRADPRAPRGKKASPHHRVAHGKRLRGKKLRGKKK